MLLPHQLLVEHTPERVGDLEARRVRGSHGAAVGEDGRDEDHALDPGGLRGVHEVHDALVVHGVRGLGHLERVARDEPGADHDDVGSLHGPREDIRRGGDVEAR